MYEKAFYLKDPNTGWRADLRTGVQACSYADRQIDSCSNTELNAHEIFRDKYPIKPEELMKMTIKLYELASFTHKQQFQRDQNIKRF